MIVDLTFGWAMREETRFHAITPDLIQKRMTFGSSASMKSVSMIYQR